MSICSKIVNYYYVNIASSPAIRPTVTQTTLLLFTPITTLFLIILFSTNVPFYDQWRFVPLLNQFYEQKINITDFWAQHNEHRIVFPRILMLILAAISSWDIRVEIGAIWVMAIMIFLILCRAANRQFGSWDEEGNMRRPYSIYVALSILIFSMVQAENWFWGWQITIFMSVFTTVYGYYILVYRPYGKYISLSIAVVCGIVAMFSFANGLLYWPIGIFIMLIDSFKNRRVIKEYALWILVSALSYVIYFIDYQQVSHHPSLLYGFSNPINLVGYFLVFLGSPIFQAGKYIEISFILGLSGLITGIYFLNFLFRRGRLFESKFLFWHSLLLYVLLTDTITSLGRSGFGVQQALSGRYVTISNLFWVWLIVIGYEVVKPHENVRFYNLTPFIFLITTLFIGLSGIRNTKVCRLDQQKLLLQERQLRSGNLDFVSLSKIYKESPTLVLLDNKILKQRHLSFYAH